ncbi:hypothetical protein PSM36_0612 [Proteiniphilum saccharofermentans]|uniref:Uncharacterized protein n=1 Tax=Proteiniphilum saccharofermentans TaxID=1642647 RepID=A0A1R3T055_9BACT|nr:hypothetical protein PSM36_0612 [Proteiniphilum saccharofermentans]
MHSKEKLFSPFICYLYLLRSLEADGSNKKLFYFCRTGQDNANNPDK